eukprot:13149.XXX_218465_218311_1 [CDS] Oithona nana genome sequencing.
MRKQGKEIITLLVFFKRRIKQQDLYMFFTSGRNQVY